MNRPIESPLWRFINEHHLSEERLRDLSTFKSDEVNFKIALWNPHTNGVRYLKALIYNLATSLPADGWEKLSRIKNRHVGRPWVVRFNHEEVCLDYLQAVYELSFVERELRLDGRHILEIGAGYGRTCHAIIANHPSVSYHIVDLENFLELSRSYLKAVLTPEAFARVTFVPLDGVDQLADRAFHLAINIDSFGEMSGETVHSYLDYINDHCRFLYVKNPVGKYQDPSLDDLCRPELVELALSAGILRDVVDIHDNVAVRRQATEFVSAYRPGKGWKCVSDAWAPPWSFYWQALYARTGGRPNQLGMDTAP